MTEGYDFEGYKKDTTDRPMNKAWSNWWKRAAVGDKVQGYIADVGYKPAEGKWKEQRVITLKQVDGTFINVPIKRIDFILDKTNGLRLGDPLTIVFEEENPSKTAGYSPTKIDGFYGKNLPENAGNRTVAELEAADMAGEQGAVDEAKKADEEFANAGKVAAPAEEKAAE